MTLLLILQLVGGEFILSKHNQGSASCAICVVIAPSSLGLMLEKLLDLAMYGFVLVYELLH
jgi:hypothetical protein